MNHADLILNRESRVVCLRPSECGFSLIVRLVREVIKITRGVLARVFFWGFGGWNRGRFCGFFAVVAKVPNLFYPGFVCLVLFFAVFDFLIFLEFLALSGCAVGGLYGCGFN